MSVKLLANMHT